jgi:hypothetical protein
MTKPILPVLIELFEPLYRSDDQAKPMGQLNSMSNGLLTDEILQVND